MLLLCTSRKVHVKQEHSRSQPKEFSKIYTLPLLRSGGSMHTHDVALKCSKTEIGNFCPTNRMKWEEHMGHSPGLTGTLQLVANLHVNKKANWKALWPKYKLNAYIIWGINIKIIVFKLDQKWKLYVEIILNINIVDKTLHNSTKSRNNM